MAKKAPTPIDLEVGRRIRLYRVQAGMTQTELGNAIGVTFQQVQKYERAANRVGAGRLDQISAAVNVPVSAFFNGAAHAKGPAHADLLTRPYAARLLKAFAAIEDERLQLELVRLVDALSHPDGKAK